MPITLKHINISDSDSIKLDKVNYNFDQLVANGGGPSGPQGSIGQTGVQGTTGFKGFQGPQGNNGFQGAQGLTSENYWKRIVPDIIDADTLIPVSNASDQFAPVVNIGYIENDSQYGTKPALVGGKTPYQWLINRKQYSSSNLRFLNSNITGNSYNFRLEKTIDGKHQITLGFEDPLDSTSTYKAAITSFKGSITSPDSLTINDTSVSFKTVTQFDSPVIIKEQLFIEDPTAGTNKVVVSDDNAGLVKFKSVQELSGTVPFGTIVSILPDIFLDNDNFINTEQVTLSSDIPVQISVGKGIGAYEGWYLCHGKEWTDGTLSGTYQVPMLGKFNYNIEDNPFSTDPAGQGSVITSNNKTHITGGSDVDMTATAVPTLVYNITSTVNTSVVNVNPGTGTTFKIKQLPQIIYLYRNDLYWQDGGSNQTPQSEVTYKLDDIGFPWDLATVTEIHTSATGEPTMLTMEINPPTGAYWIDLPIFTSPSGITTYTTTVPAIGDPLVVTIEVDSQGVDGSEVTITYDSENYASVLPDLIVDAGPDQSVDGPGPYSLNFAGSVTGETGLTIAEWTQSLSNPEVVSFDNPNSLTPEVTGFNTDGTYDFTLTVNDSLLSGSDDMSVIVTGALPAPTPPSSDELIWTMSKDYISALSFFTSSIKVRSGATELTLEVLIEGAEGSPETKSGVTNGFVVGQTVGVTVNGDIFSEPGEPDYDPAASITMYKQSRTYPYPTTLIGTWNGTNTLLNAVQLTNNTSPSAPLFDAGYQYIVVGNTYIGGGIM